MSTWIVVVARVVEHSDVSRREPLIKGWALARALGSYKKRTQRAGI